jgi:hypothetical protein
MGDVEVLNSPAFLGNTVKTVIMELILWYFI